MEPDGFMLHSNATFSHNAGYKAINKLLTYYSCNFQFTTATLDLDFFQILSWFYRRIFILQKFYSCNFFLQLEFFPALNIHSFSFTTIKKIAPIFSLNYSCTPSKFRTGMLLLPSDP